MPSLVQNGRDPSTPSSLPIARLREHTCVSRLWVPSSFLSFGSGSVSTTLSGPRLDALVDVGSYPSPAADGRDWKYCGRALPSLSVNSWPMSALPTVLPFTVTSDPSA